MMCMSEVYKLQESVSLRQHF